MASTASASCRDQTAMFALNPANAPAEPLRQMKRNRAPVDNHKDGPPHKKVRIMSEDSAALFVPNPANAPAVALRDMKRKRDPVDRHGDEPPHKKIRIMLEDNAVPSNRPESKAFPFLKLPGEIRNRIYDLVLKAEKGIHLKANQLKEDDYWPPHHFELVRKTKTIVKGRRPYIRYHGRRYVGKRYPIYITRFETPFAEPPLLAVNRQIRYEASAIFWGQNEFFMESSLALYAFLKTCSPRVRALLKRITVFNWLNDPRDTLQAWMAGSCYNLLQPLLYVEADKEVGLHDLWGRATQATTFVSKEKRVGWRGTKSVLRIRRLGDDSPSIEEIRSWLRDRRDAEP